MARRWRGGGAVVVRCGAVMARLLLLKCAINVSLRGARPESRASKTWVVRCAGRVRCGTHAKRRMPRVCEAMVAT